MLNAPNALRREILLDQRDWLISSQINGDDVENELLLIGVLDGIGCTDADVFRVWRDVYIDGDALEEFRCSGHEVDDTSASGIEVPHSRNYEVEMKAKLLRDGTWVCWPYFYGGGKWGEPQAVSWIEQAFYVQCTEREQVVIHRSFKRVSDE